MPAPFEQRKENKGEKEKLRPCGLSNDGVYCCAVGSYCFARSYAAGLKNRR